jgi:hypothetical protein
VLTKAMTWLSVAALAMAVYSRSSVPDLRMTGLVVCVGAVAVLIRAIRLHERYWTAGMIVIVALFNPVVPLPVSHTMILGVELACIVTFLSSLFALRTRPLLSIPSITDRTPGSESL